MGVCGSRVGHAKRKHFTCRYVGYILHSSGRNFLLATRFFSRRGRKWFFVVELLTIQQSIFYFFLFLCLSLFLSYVRNILWIVTRGNCVSALAIDSRVEMLSVCASWLRTVEMFDEIYGVEIKCPEPQT